MNNRTRNAIIALGVVQGLLLLIGYLFIDNKLWHVVDDAALMLPWFAVAIAVPTALQLMLNDVRDRRVWRPARVAGWPWHGGGTNVDWPIRRLEFPSAQCH
jgi:hypothetical protein